MALFESLKRTFPFSRKRSTSRATSSHQLLRPLMRCREESGPGRIIESNAINSASIERCGLLTMALQ